MEYMGIKITEYRITIRRKGENQQVMTFPEQFFCFFTIEILGSIFNAINSMSKIDIIDITF